MRILVIGGTQFVGRHVVEAALAAGDDLTLFHRGRTNPGLFAEAEHRLGDRDGDLAALADGEWDATIDCSAYVPRQVRSLAAVVDEVGPPGTELAWVDAAVLTEAGVTEANLPMWERAGPGLNLIAAAPDRAIAAGLRVRPLARTIAGVHQHELAHPTPQTCR